MKPFFSVTLALALFSSGLQAAELSLADYLDQVRKENPQLRSAKAQDTAYALAAQESLTAFSPQLKAQLQRYSSRTEALVPMMAAKENDATTWSAGLGKLFGTGTYVGLDYMGDNSRLDFGAPPAGLGSFEGYGQEFTLTLSQPLWRNLMAREAKAGIGRAMAGAESARAGNRYQAQALLLQARTTYVQLGTVRQAVLLQAESFERNQKLLDWTKRKYADNLADKVDVLQVEAALRQVQLSLSQSREDEAKAMTRFNQLRGRAPAEPVEQLEAQAVPAALPTTKGSRQDLEAARAALRSGDFRVESVEQRYTPDISVFASLGVNDRDAELGPSFGNAFKGDHASSVVGVKASANLDLGLIRSALKAAHEAKGAGEAELSAKEQEVAADWAQLQSQWQALGARLSLARELEGLQKEKAEREKRRYLDGRTTNFQVLRFEDDYALSRLQILQLSAAALALEAQARFYNGEDQPW